MENKLWHAWIEYREGTVLPGQLQIGQERPTHDCQYIGEYYNETQALKFGRVAFDEMTTVKNGELVWVGVLAHLDPDPPDQPSTVVVHSEDLETLVPHLQAASAKVIIEYEIEALAAKRQALEAVRETVECLRQQWETDNAELLARYERLRDSVKDSEQVVRDAAIAFAEQTNAQHPHEAVKVKRYTRVNYDLDAATEWARKYATYHLVLDKKTFEDTKKAFPHLIPDDIASAEEYWKPFIDSDLSQWIPEGSDYAFKDFGKADDNAE